MGDFFFRQTMELMTPEGNLRLMIAMNIDKKKAPWGYPIFLNGWTNYGDWPKIIKKNTEKKITKKHNPLSNYGN